MTNEELCLLIQSGQDRQKNIEALYTQNRGLLASICNNYSKISDHTFEDLMQQSFFPLVTAAEEWIPVYDVSFSGYAVKVIKRDLLRYIEETGSIIRKPCWKVGQIRKYKLFIKQFVMENGREPSILEACEALQISQEELEQLKLEILTDNIDSLLKPLPMSPDLILQDTIPDPEDKYEEVDNRLFNDELAEKLWPLVDKLKADEKLVVRSFYKDEKPTAQIAAETGDTTSHVNSLRMSGLSNLRRYKSRLQPYLDDLIYSKAVKKTGLRSFRQTFTSSTEYVALKMLEMKND